MKSFNIATILTLLTGRFYCKDINDLYDILNYLTGQSLMTHHLPVAKDYILLNHLSIFPQPFNTIGKDWTHTKDWENDVKVLQDRYGNIKLPENIVDQESFGNYMIENSLLLKQAV